MPVVCIAYNIRTDVFAHSGRHTDIVFASPCPGIYGCALCTPSIHHPHQPEAHALAIDRFSLDFASSPAAAERSRYFDLSFADNVPTPGKLRAD